MSEQKTGYTDAEIADLHEQGHHIGAPMQKLHADTDDGAKAKPIKQVKTNDAGIPIELVSTETPELDAETKIQDAVKEAVKK